MSIAFDNPIQTPSSGRVASSRTLEPSTLAIPLQDTPDSQVSIKSQASYDFWGAEQQPRDDGPLTPTTPLSPENCQTKVYLVEPQSAHLKRFKSDSQLSAQSVSASEPDTRERGRHVKAEPDINKPGWLTALLYQNEHLKDSESPKRASSANRLDSTEADFWATGTEIDLNFSRRSPPLSNANSRVLRSGMRTGITEKSRQASRTRFRKTERVQVDSPTPSPSKGSHPPKAKVRELATGSEAELTAESRPISAETDFGQVQRQSDFSVQVQVEEIHQLPEGTNHILSESKFTERLSDTTAVFNSTLTKILPFNIRERLFEDPNRCVASCLRRKPGQRCSKKAKGPPEAVTEYLKSLSDNDVRSEHSRTFQYIEGLIHSALCKSGSHRKVATRELKKWRISLDALLTNQGHAESQDDCPSAEMTAFAVWIEALTGVTTSTATAHADSIHQITFSDGTPQPIPKIQISSAETSIEVTEDRELTSVNQDSATVTTTVWRRRLTKVQYLHYVQEFQRYLPKSIAHLSAPQALKETLIRPLSDQDRKSGHIYIYWFRGNFGYLKIGITSRDIDTRLEEWVRQCKHEVEGYYTEDMLRQVAVPHVFRVEALVHRELRDVRYQEVPCKGCGKSHKEWFHVPVGHATKVVKKWCDWMRENPYEADSEREGAEWRLKGSIEESVISSLCQPLELPTAALVVRDVGGRLLRRSSRSTAGKRRVS